MKIILFLCTGNYYRSRFAEYLFNALAEKEGLSWRADSRGLATERGVNNVGPMSPYIVERLASLGISIRDRDRFPHQASPEDFTAARKIIALDESEHRPLMEQRFPEWAEAIEYWLVHDIDKTSPDLALAEIERLVCDLIRANLDEQ